MAGDLSELGRHFLARARGDALALGDLCRMLEEEGDEAAAAALARMSNLLHRLAGTAGSFGLERIGLRARRLDRLCRLLQSGEDGDRAARLVALVEGVQELAMELDAPAEPFAIAGMAASPAAADSSDGEPLAAPSDDAPCIGVVAADPGFRQRLRQALEGFGYRVCEYDAIVEIEPDADAARVDAIVARVDPAELAASGLRDLRGRRPDPVPLVVVSPRNDFEGFLASVRGGADGYSSEPLDLPRLEARLNYLIERRGRDGLRVMLVDDDRDLLAACTRILEAAGMAVASTDDPTRALAVLSDFRPEVVVMDIRMPQCTGPELAQIIRMHEEWLHVPIVYMSTQSDGADQLLATGKAGEAFLAKPIDARELIATVAANGRHARQMVETASKDTLTGLLKHSFIKEHLAAELERAQRLHTPTCAAMIDIDHFKEVNDRHGHAAGDLVIRTLASVLRQRLRVVDGIGRLGGEEFLAVLSNCASAEAAAILDGIRRRFGQIAFEAADGSSFRVSFSAGVAESRGSTHGAADLLAAADKALYRAKGQGRNRVLLAHL
jgi:diguanylate cyclase (GGDEF)-like protein